MNDDMTPAQRIAAIAATAPRTDANGHVMMTVTDAKAIDMAALDKHEAALEDALAKATERRHWDEAIATKRALGNLRKTRTTARNLLA